MTKKTAAAGAVLWRRREELEIALVHRNRYDDWSLPKGKLEDGESTRVAAMREVAEETGAHAALGRFLGQIRYRVEAGRKTVDYFAARYLDGDFAPSEEVDELRWLPMAQARPLLSYDQDRAVVDTFAALPPEQTTLLLVRHAKAGSRSEWHEADELRPLSKTGQRQVPPVRVLGRLYGADRVYAAPLVRCVQTVQPIADDLDVKVAEELLFAERTYEGMAEPALRRLSEIVADGGVPVVCSQGGVIPDLVTRAAGPAGLPVKRVESKKGSVWALFFAGTELVAADYIAVP